MINPHLTYLLLMVFTISYPLANSWERRIQFAKQWRFMWPGMLISALVFIGMDELFTRWGIWSFNPEYVLGIYLGHLPIEEVSFFFCVPFSCVFIYECIRYFFKPDIWQKTANAVTALLVIVLGSLALYHVDRTYTSVKLGMCALVLVLHWLWFRDRYLGRFYLAYLFVLLPFFVVNGMLTWLPVVSYDNAENLGIRYSNLLPLDFLNIPIEDTFYGLTLIVMNVSFMEYFREKSTRLQTTKTYTPTPPNSQTHAA